MTSIITSKEIEFNERTHRYKVKGSKRYIPSVTTITSLLDKPFLFEWASRISAEAVADFAREVSLDDDKSIQAAIATGRLAPRMARTHGASVGTAVHQRINHFYNASVDTSSFIEESIEVSMAMDAFYKWNDLFMADKTVEYSEQIVVHPSGEYCGTFDLLAVDANGLYYLCDFKTTNKSESNSLGLYPEYLLQLAAYKRAIEECSEISVDSVAYGVVVGLGKDGSLSEVMFDADALDKYFESFDILAKILPAYRGMQKEIRKLNKHAIDYIL